MPRTWQPLVPGARVSAPLPGLVARGEGKGAVLEHSASEGEVHRAATIAELCFWARQLAAIDWTADDVRYPLLWDLDDTLVAPTVACDLVADVLDELLGEGAVVVVPGGQVGRTYNVGAHLGVPMFIERTEPATCRVLGRGAITLAPTAGKNPPTDPRWSARKLFAALTALAPALAGRGFTPPKPAKPTPTPPPGLEPCVWRAGGKAGVVWLEGARPALTDGSELSAMPWAKVDHDVAPDVVDATVEAAAMQVAERRLEADCPVRAWLSSRECALTREHEADPCLWPGRELRQACRVREAEATGIVGADGPTKPAADTPAMRRILRQAKSGDVVVVGASALGRPTIEDIGRVWHAVARGSDLYVRGWRPHLELEPLLAAGTKTAPLDAWARELAGQREPLVESLKEAARAEGRVSWVDPTALLRLVPLRSAWQPTPDEIDLFADAFAVNKAAWKMTSTVGTNRLVQALGCGAHPADAWAFGVIALLIDVLGELGPHKGGAVIVMPPPFDWTAAAWRAIQGWSEPELRPVWYGAEGA